MSKNTLLNYFTKSPMVNKNEKNVPTVKIESTKTPNTVNSEVKQNTNKIMIKSELNLEIPSKKRNRSKSLEKFNSPTVNKKSKTDENTKKDLSKEFKNTKCTKRRRILMELDSEEDSNDEYNPENVSDLESDESEDLASEDITSSSELENSTVENSNNNNKKKKKKNEAFKQLNIASTTEKPKILPSISIRDLDNESWPHLKLTFLQPDKIRDSKKRLKNDPNYDPKTLYVPEDFKNNLTPAVRQWWEMKAQNFDVVLFFKVGKFYELYNMDAVIAANELNLTFMRGEFAHVGFPEIAYGRFSATLIEKGYKVARVEQTETPEMMNERCKTLTKCTKFDKVVKREICQITSRGTRVFGILDGETKEAESRFLLAVSEKEIDNVSSCYGVCFVDTSIGLFHIGQFADDRHTSRLRTLIAHYSPVQILLEKNQFTYRTQLIFNTVVSNAVKDILIPDVEFWSASKTLIKLAEDYFTDNNFPKPLVEFIGEDALINMVSKDETELGIKALGAVVWCLQRCLIDFQLLTLGQFCIYKPIDVDKPNFCYNDRTKNEICDRYMVLDAVTLKNLHILENSDGNIQGTLLQKLDNCCTPFGKRLLQRWICSPLGNINSIKIRQEAVSFLCECGILQDVRSLLSQLPDLDRLLSRIHSQGTRGIRESHPDTRAFLFEEKKYSKKKILDFISALNGFKIALKTVRLFEKIEIKKIPNLIRRCCVLSSKNKESSFPNLEHHLEFFEKAFDHDEAQKEGRILPSVGTDVEYDKAIENLKSIEKELNQYLKEQCSHFKCKVTYFGSDKKRYQLEVPESAIRRANSEYELQGQRKGFKRYTTVETRKFVERMIAAEEQKINVLKNLRERIFSKFSEKFNDWSAAIQCLSVLDVLSSFAVYSKNESVTCLPQFIPITSSEQPFIYLMDGCYPCSMSDDIFIPNSTIVGGNDGDFHPPLLLVTGPNMGGKSTLMRQLGLIVIMAHMGCHVPAVELKLSLIDRIFTRLGANDNIMAGESTFYVELCETSSILQHATKHSLVLVDELGRGTATYDGTAIAFSVLNELCQFKCRTLFSTHYHSLIEDFKNNKNVSLGHMMCMVENENEDEENSSEEMVTFLYKFSDGACPKSYGFNAARLAGMPKNIIKLGQQRAKQLEIDVCKRSVFKQLFQSYFDRVQQLIIAL